MYKNLNAESLGINARHNELIEHTLTYQFRGFDIDLPAFLEQVASRGVEHAARFIQSANIQIGSFELPIDFAAEEAEYQAAFEKLPQSLNIAKQVGAEVAIATLAPFSDQRAYHEDFELHRARISEVAQAVDPLGIRIALNFLAPAHHREGHAGQFICNPDSILTLLQTIAEQNVGLCLDAWHWHVGGGTMEQLQEFSVARVYAVRVADLPVGADLATVTEKSRAIPGTTGEVPLNRLFRWLRENDYQGSVTAFCHPEQFVGSKRTKFVAQVAKQLDGLIVGTSAPEPGEVEGESNSEATAATS